MEFNRGLIGGTTDMVILSLLDSLDMYGYEIIQELEERSDGAFLFKEGTLYPILHRLEADKYLKSYKKKGDRGRARKYYKITAEGRKFLEEEIDLWKKFIVAVDKTIDRNEKDTEVVKASKEEKSDEGRFRKGNILF